MDWRFVRTVVAGSTAFITLVGVAAFGIASLAPVDTATVAANSPLLITGATASAPPLPFFPPQIETRRGAPIAGEYAPANTGSVPPQQVLAVAAPRPSVKPSNDIINLHIDGALERPGGQTVMVVPARPAKDARVSASPGQPGPGLAAPVRVPERPLVEPSPNGVFTPSEVRRMKAALRLTAEQVPYWPAVEGLLLEIGGQQAALVKVGRRPDEAFGNGAAMRMYFAARPLLGVLREDQKAEIRRRARLMGFTSVASAI